jgi:hypothetical protein
MSKWLQFVDYYDNGANHIKLSILVNKYQKDTKPDKHTKEDYFNVRHGYSDNRGNVVGGHYKPLNACTHRYVGEYAQRLHLLALGLATRVWFACAKQFF